MREYRVQVVIPARNEQRLLGAAVASVRDAVDYAQLRLEAAVSSSGTGCSSPGGFAAGSPAAGRLEARVTVVADRCTDHTVLIGQHLADQVVIIEAGSPGAARREGFEASLCQGDPDLLLSTDADSTVPPGWIFEHLRHVESGADAVAGTVRVNDWRPRSDTLRRRYTSLYQTRGEHVHGANLGISAAAYQAVGGFTALSSGEDQDIADRLLAAGFRLDWCTNTSVSTSARRTGRAEKGFADYLNELEATG